MRQLKSKKFIKAASKAFIIAFILANGVLLSGCGEFVDSNESQIEETIGIAPLAENESVSALAQMYGIKDLLYKDGEEFVRFECNSGQPINVIVDENSLFEMVDKNIEAIKISVDKYNELFSYINPNYQFRYISKKDYELQKDNNPCIFITSQLNIKTANGYARAVTSPPSPVESDNGKVSKYATMILSSTGLINLEVDQITSIIMHEMAHALCISNHSLDADSIMHAYGNGQTIASDEFSEDVMYAMLALYYNSHTNPYSFDEILSYIRNKDDLRMLEIDQNFENDEIEFDSSSSINSDEQSTSSAITPEEQSTSLEVYLENAEQYMQYNELQFGDIIGVVGNSYSATSIYGQQSKFTFNSDGSYVITIDNSDQILECYGTYKIENNVVICEGEFVAVENGNLTTKQDKIFVSLLNDNSIIYGTENNQNYIRDRMSEITMEMDK